MRGQVGAPAARVAEACAGSHAAALALMDTRCCAGGPKFPQYEPTRRVRRARRSPVRRGRYPDRGLMSRLSSDHWAFGSFL